MANKRSPKKNISQLDNQIVISKLEDSASLSKEANVALVQRTYKLSGNRANQTNETELFAASAEESFRTLKENINLNLKELQSHPDTKVAKSLEEEMSKLSELTNNLIKSFKSRQEIEPKLSIIRPDVTLVDASLAYKYADLQSDVNNLTSLATLFLGTGIAAIISGIVTYVTDKDTASMALYLTASFFSIIVTIIFWILATSANKKARLARTALESGNDAVRIQFTD